MRSRPTVHSAAGRVAATPASSAANAAPGHHPAVHVDGVQQPPAELGRHRAAAASPTSHPANASPGSPAKAETSTDSVRS